jgi:predicted nucleic acid-binding protein
MNFIDTNVFVYAHDETDRAKTDVARRLLLEASSAGTGLISTQVIQEFCNVALKKSVMPLRAEDVGRIVRESLEPMLAHRPDAPFYLRVLATFERYSLSFYDAAIVQAAVDLDCDVLYSEDLQAGSRFGGLRVVNPFA